ncbi:hypothetical protein EBB07_09885 [Paenibacillaceae bacterium]|nr:hypothetical protein EBB07_09885 [Paenibacillaceae bacterium]
MLKERNDCFLKLYFNLLKNRDKKSGLEWRLKYPAAPQQHARLSSKSEFGFEPKKHLIILDESRILKKADKITWDLKRRTMA